MSTPVLNHVAFMCVPIEDKALIKFLMDADDVWPPGVLFQKGYDSPGRGVSFPGMLCQVVQLA